MAKTAISRVKEKATANKASRKAAKGAKTKSIMDIWEAPLILQKGSSAGCGITLHGGYVRTTDSYDAFANIVAPDGTSEVATVSCPVRERRSDPKYIYDGQIQMTLYVDRRKGDLIVWVQCVFIHLAKTFYEMKITLPPIP